MPMPDLDFPETNSQTNLTPRYLADAKDITIDEYSGGSGIGMFGRDPDLDLLPVDDVERNRYSLTYDDLEEEPLMFTPSQQRSAPSTPRRSASSAGSAVESAAGSVEKMRDAAMPGDGPPGTPRLSFDPATPGSAPRDFRGSSPNQLEREETPVPFHSEGGDGRDSMTFTPAGGDDDMPPPGSPQFLMPTDLELVLAGVGGDDKTLGGLDGVVGGDGGSNNIIALKEGSDVSGGEEDGAVPDADVKAHRRKKRANAALWDKETEFPASFVRKCLIDTSDILRPQKRSRVTLEARRRIEAERGLTAQDLLARPVFPLLAPELNELFTSCINVASIFKAPGSPVTTSVGGRKSRSNVERDSDDDEEDDEEAEDEECEDEGVYKAGKKSSLAARNLDDVVPASPERADTGDAGDQSLPTANDKEIAEDEGVNDAARLSMSEPRFSLGDASSVGDVHLPPIEDELPLPFPADEPELPLPDTRGPNSSDATYTHGVEALTLMLVAHTQVAVKDADAATDGELGDARMTTRALKMRDLLAERIEPKTGRIPFSKVLADEPGITRRVAARSFYELLNLCSKRVISLEQDVAYGDIVVVPVQPAFDSVASDGAKAVAHAHALTA
jgi:Conserved region of Rad21 / Rec8 like protein